MYIYVYIYLFFYFFLLFIFTIYTHSYTHLQFCIVEHRNFCDICLYILYVDRGLKSFAFKHGKTFSFRWHLLLFEKKKQKTKKNKFSFSCRGSKLFNPPTYILLVGNFFFFFLFFGYIFFHRFIYIYIYISSHLLIIYLFIYYTNTHTYIFSNGTRPLSFSLIFIISFIRLSKFFIKISFKSMCVISRKFFLWNS